MAAIAETPNVSEHAPAKKSISRKALKQQNPSPNEPNIQAGLLPKSSLSVAAYPGKSTEKENHERLSQPKSQKKTNKGTSKAKQQQPFDVSSFKKELQKMQEKLEKMKLEKEQTEEILKEKDELLETKDKELKKLQKMKEFKPTMIFPMGLSLKEQYLEKKDKKKKGDPTKKKPSPRYILWCKEKYSEEMKGLMSAKWKRVTPEEKKPYEEMYQDEKELYLKIVGN